MPASRSTSKQNRLPAVEPRDAEAGERPPIDEVLRDQRGEEEVRGARKQPGALTCRRKVILPRYGIWPIGWYACGAKRLDRGSGRSLKRGAAAAAGYGVVTAIVSRAYQQEGIA